MPRLFFFSHLFLHYSSPYLFVRRGIQTKVQPSLVFVRGSPSPGMDLIHKKLQAYPRNPLPHIVFAEGEDERIVKAARQIQTEGKLRVTIVSKAPLPGLTVVSPGSESPLDVANRLVRDGSANGSVIGAATASGTVIVSALKSVGVKPGAAGAKGLVSSFFLLSRADRPEPIFLADCAVVLDPTAEQLASIAMDTADNARDLLGVQPRIAMLSFVTGAVPDKPAYASAAKVKKATEIVRQAGFDVEGPIQFDAAVEPSVAAVKFKGGNHVVPGRANVLVFPDLNAGNIGYKIAERFGGWNAVGPVLQGLKLPCNDLSRGCSAQDVVDVSYVTALQSLSAQGGKSKL